MQVLLGAFFILYILIVVQVTFFRILPNGLQAENPIQYSADFARKFNSDCSNVYYIGTGMPFWSSLWGVDACGKVVKSLNFAVAHQVTFIGPRELYKTEIIDFLEIFDFDSKNKILVCSFQEHAEIFEKYEIESYSIDSTKNLCDTVGDILNRKYRIKIVDVQMEGADWIHRGYTVQSKN